MVFVGNRARRHHSHNVARNNFARLFRRVLKLFAYGNFFAALNELCNIVIRSMIRNAAHRRTVFKSAVSARESYPEQIRCSFGVVEEHLVKVAQPVEENAVFVFFLYRKVMFHHR